MYKFLVALAEMFSAFAAKLHDMSANEPEFVTAHDVRNIIKELPDTLDRNDVIDIVQEAIDEGNINTSQECDERLEADDIRDFSYAVCREIDEYDFDQKLADYAFYTSVASLIFMFCDEHGIDTRGIYMAGEVSEIKRFLLTRKDKWDAWSVEELRRVKERTIREYKREMNIQETVDHPCPPSPPSIDI